MATRLEATLSADEKRMRRNSEKIASDDAFNKGKAATKARFSRLEELKPLPRGKAANEKWEPPSKKRVVPQNKSSHTRKPTKAKSAKRTITKR
jgi:hypothetical protein